MEEAELAEELARRDRVLVDDAVEDLSLRRALERRPRRQAFVKDGAQGVDVGAAVDVPRPAFGLLGRHVAGRALRHAGDGQAWPVAHLLGQAEIH